MNDKYQEEYIAGFIIFGLLIVFSVFMLRQYFYTSDKPLDIINAAILFWTGAVIVIYTIETHRLREAAQKQIEVAQKQLTESQRQIEVAHGQLAESQRQTELGLRPFIILDVDAAHSVSSMEYKTYVKNLGNGTAVNVTIRQVKATCSGYIYTFPEAIPILTAGARLPIRCYPDKLIVAPEVKQVSLRNLYYQDCQETVILHITFKNIEGQWYYVEQTIVPKDLQFLFGKVQP